MARSLRAWILTLPAGIGKATAIACIKLLLRFPLHRVGYQSAGNGPAMRSAIIGVLYGHDLEHLRDLVKASTQLTHTDPRAETGAFLVALAAGTPGTSENFFAKADPIIADNDAWHPILAGLKESVQRGESTSDYAAAMELQKGVTGYILHTVPVTLHAALSTNSVRDAIIAAVECGGDSDTVGAIAGAVSGARHGSASIPEEWISSWRDFPITMRYLDDLANYLFAMCEGKPTSTPSFAWILAFLRNLLFLAIVFLHVLRRMLPPY